MPEDSPDGEDDHQHERPSADSRAGATDGEEADEAELGEVDAHRQLLESTGVCAAFGVDLRAQGEEDVVSECEV